jgi:hypothetical protein
MMFRSSLLLALTITIAVSGQEINDELNDSNGMALQEEYSEASSALSSSSISTIATTSKDTHKFLRRELQALPSCRAVNSRNIYVCGGQAGVTTDVCQGSTATCEGQRYPCTCAGITETSCAYCQIRTANSIMCQVTGTTTTYVDTNYQAKTCTCEYIGYGQVNQTCYNPEAKPIPFQPPSVPAPQPIETPAPISYSLQPQETVTPPMWLSPFEFRQMRCQAVTPSTPILAANASCSDLPHYPCTCSGSSETSCTYCQIRAFESIRCMVSGAIDTFTDPVGNIATCRCDYKGYGQAQSYCYQGAPPDIPTPSTPAPVVPTAPRDDPGVPQPVQVATQAPVYVAPPTDAPVYIAPPIPYPTDAPVYVAPPVEYTTVPPPVVYEPPPVENAGGPPGADGPDTKKSKKRRRLSSNK